MTIATANGVEINYEARGDGAPLILVHGSWFDLHSWDPVAGALARSFGVVAYDRRGSGSSRRDHEATRRDHEGDLASLIEHIDSGPMHVVATSFGGSIALGFAARRPELVRSLVVHEPPLFSIVAGDPSIAPLLAPVTQKMQAVTEEVERGDASAAAKLFVEEVAFGPGAWDQLPPETRATMIDTAPAFAAEQRDPDWADMDLDGLRRIAFPVLLTQGDQSPPWFGRIVAALREALEGAVMHTYAGAGHAPHRSHPDDYLATVEGFLRR